MPAPVARAGTGRRRDRAGAAVVLVAPLLALLFVAGSVRGALEDAQTSDEAVTIASGWSFLSTRRVLLNPEHPMLAKAAIAAPLAALSPRLELDTDAWRRRNEWVAAYELLWENRVPGQRLLLAARLPVVAMGLALVGLVFAAARKLYGEAAGLLALAAATGCPDLIAHSHLATLDVPLALAGALALGTLLSFAARPGRGRHAALSVAVGIALATKISALQLVPALAVAAAVRAAVDPGLAGRGSVPVPRRLASRPRLASLYVMAGGLAVACGYGGLLLAASYLGSPLPYLAGLERNALLAGYGHPTFLLGETTTRGFPGYFLVALGVKLPVLVLGLFAVSLATWPWLRLGRFRVELPALAFAAALVAEASFGPAQTGVRYVLPAYPVGLVFLGRFARVPAGRPGLRAAFLAVVIGTLAAVGVASHGASLSYSNEIAGGARGGSRVLLDSNLDWGQDLGRLGRWLEARGNPPIRLAAFSNAPPEAYGIRYQAAPAAGPVLPPRPELLGPGDPDLLAVSANNLEGLFFDRDLYGWLRGREPLAVAGGSIWIFELAPEDHERLAATYRAAGWRRWAIHERALASGADAPP